MRRRGMFGRVYRWKGGYWRVIRRWQGKGPRNVLLERVEPEPPHSSIAAIYTNPQLRFSEGHWWRVTGELVVRPFRGLRRLPEGFE